MEKKKKKKLILPIFLCFSLANKQDQEGALDEIDVCDQLNLEDIVNECKCPCKVVSGETALVLRARKFKGGICCGSHLAIIYTTGELLYLQIFS